LDCTLLGDPSLAAVMLAHQATLLRLVGICVAGEKDVEEALAPTTLRCVHARFGPAMRAVFPACGDAMRATLAQALGDAFTADVEAAWSGVFDCVAVHMVAGIAAAEHAAQAEAHLRDELLLGGGGAPTAAAAA
jgi:hemoglobin-like flavoprotein